MKEFIKRHELFFFILGVVVICLIFWYFSLVIGYIFLSAIIAIIGRPLVEVLDRVKIGRFHLPHVLNVTVTLLLILALCVGFLAISIPLIVQEVTLISQIDITAILEHYQEYIDAGQSLMAQTGILEPNQSLEAFIEQKVESLISLATFSTLISNALKFTGEFLFGLFTVVFLAFYFLADKKLLPGAILGMVPEKYQEQTKNVLRESKVLLSRYFIGLVLDVLFMMVGYTIGLMIIGVKSAIVIAIFGGVIHIIPYLGPWIAAFVGVILGTTTALSTGSYDIVLPIALNIILVFVIVVLIENLIIQPLIFGKSVRAHPIEIYLVIVLAGIMGGIIGMIIAVPVYTLLRIIAKEFFSRFRVVQRITGRL
ncbi:MAG: AI-2E family transporter [Bacteroidetes bacterium]|nr:AI-2E family transporter [Bacteroidota bacterium]